MPKRKDVPQGVEVGGKCAPLEGAYMYIHMYSMYIYKLYIIVTAQIHVGNACTHSNHTQNISQSALLTRGGGSPSSPLKGSCLLIAFPGSGGTTI